MIEVLDSKTQKEIREEIRKRWEAIGIASGLSGSLKEAVEKLFEPDHKPLTQDDYDAISGLPIVMRVWSKIDGINKEKE
jgi:hypothetical protein